MNDLRILYDNGKAIVYTPYDPDFISAIKMVGGASWDKHYKAWVVPPEMVDVIRTIMVRVYGCDDNTPAEYLTLEITVNSIIYQPHGPFIMFGKTVARAMGRDSGATVGKDVAYVKGKCYSSGSTKNWCSEIEAGSVICLFHVNKNIYKKEIANISENDGYTVKLIGIEDNKKSLEEEKTQLIKRIKSIDNLLEKVAKK